MGRDSSPITRLQAWFVAACDGDWEHGHGIRIETLDNPGWSLTVDLEGSDLEDSIFAPTQIDRSDRDWVRCQREGVSFVAYGGPGNLEEMITRFLDWAQAAVGQGST